MALNFDLAGKTYDPVKRTITAEEIEEYAKASGDPNPVHAAGSDQIASPIFPVVPGFPLIGLVTSDPELNVENPLMIVHGEQEIVHHRPVRAGDELVLTPSLASVEDKGKGATFVARVIATSGDGTPVNEQLATIFVRGGGSGGERAAGGSTEHPVRGAEAASFVRHVDDSMPARYAPASGDHNPIHLDDGVAKAVGLPGVINHGLGTLSLVTGGLVEHLAGGDPARCRRIKVRFTDMVVPGSDLDTKVWESDDGFLFETTRPDGNAVMSGIFEVG